MGDRRTDHPTGSPSEEFVERVGDPDAASMRRIRDLFLAEEPLVEEASFDDVLRPRALSVEFADGIGDASRCRLDVVWYESDAYSFHYVDDEGVLWRYDRHPNAHSAEKHFHEPPDARSETAVESCIRVEEPRLVARAVWKLWRRAYEEGSFEILNRASNPP